MELITVEANDSERGSLFVIDRSLPFEVRRVFAIRDVPEGQERGFHRHHRTRQVLWCTKGSCIVHVDDGRRVADVSLDAPDRALLLEPADWHYMRDFSRDCVLTVLASHPYDPADYIRTAYR